MFPIILHELEEIKNCKENIDCCKRGWDSYETSWDYKVHPLVENALSKIFLRNLQNGKRNVTTELKHLSQMKQN